MSRRALRRPFLAAGLALVAVAAVLFARPQPSVSRGADMTPPDLPRGVERRGEHYICLVDGMPMVLVPAGSFTMGSDEGAVDERPAHRVFLPAYLIDRHEVTNRQFARFVAASGHVPQGPWQRGAGPGRDGHPVRFVTWHDAAAYAAWAGRTLPTEAQWEKAARGASALRYPWGDAWQGARAACGRDVDAGPLQVASYPTGASPCGALDLAGNVWEWVADWYDRRAYAARKGTTHDPLGPPDGAQPEARFLETGTGGGNERSTRKVIRGGGWLAGGAENARAAKRVAGDPRHWLNDTGFRCALRLAP